MNQEKGNTQKTGKPVIIYIMILFIAAFLLMALSFAMHQRSNQEALGDLETSFHATIKDMQADQEKLYNLQLELAETKDQLEETQAQAEETAAALTDTQSHLAAMEQLYCLQQEYASGDYAGCKIIIEKMESSGAIDLLASVPITTESGSVTAPFVRFQQLKEAALTKLAETEEP